MTCSPAIMNRRRPDSRGSGARSRSVRIRARLYGHVGAWARGCGGHAPPSPRARAPILLLAIPVHLQALLFDIDGTLIDTNVLHVRCWIESFAHFGKQFERDVIRHQIGKGGDLLVPDLLNAKEMRTFGEELKKYRSKLYKDEYMPQAKPFDGAKRALETLHARG